MSHWLFPLLSSLLSVVFAYFVWQQYRERQKIHQKIWAISFLLFAFATFAEFYSEVWGWNITLYRLYYVAAAALVAYMGAGTVYLIYRQRIGNIFLGYCLLVTAVMLIQVFRAPVNTAAFEPGITVAGKAMPGTVRVFSPLLTIPGTLALMGGAVYSWLKGKTFYNVLIAVGTAIIAAAGGAARMGASSWLYLGEMVGLAIIFVGFMQSREVIRAREQQVLAGKTKS